MDFAAHDGRIVHEQGLSYAVSTWSADHMFSTTRIEEYNGQTPAEGTAGKGEVVIDLENRNAVRDSAVLSQFGLGRVTEENVLEALLEEPCDLLEVDERIVELERHFNNQRGIDYEDDRPYNLPNLESAIWEYYDPRGVDGRFLDTAPHNTLRDYR